VGRCLVHGGRAIKYLVVNSVADYRTIKIYPQIPQTSLKHLFHRWLWFLSTGTAGIARTMGGDAGRAGIHRFSLR